MTQRPGVITVVCIFLFISAVVTAIITMTDAFTYLDTWIQVWTVISIILMLASMTGYFFMIRWGVYILGILFVINTIINTIFIGLHDIPGGILTIIIGSAIPLIMLFIGIVYLPDME